jgi:hypothetical protein
MIGAYQEERIDRGLDKKSKKDGQEMIRRCLGRAGVRLLAVTGSPDEWRTSELARDKQLDKQTRRAFLKLARFAQQHQSDHSLIT